MNIQFHIEKLHSSEMFRDFRKENPDAYLFSGFFVIDKEGSENRVHFDYFSPKKNEAISFQLENMQKVKMESFGEEIPKEISGEIDFDLNEIEDLIIEKMKEEKINPKIQKMLFSLQKIEGNDVFVGTVFIPMLGLIKANIDLNEMKITEFEKKSFLDMVKIIRKGE